MSQNNVVILSSESYSDLLIQVQKWFEVDGLDVDVQDSHFLSDRFAKKVYYLCVYKHENASYELG